MSKPGWDDAPDWANWHASDAHGLVWFLNEPEFMDGMWCDELEGPVFVYKAGEFKISKECRP